MDRRGLHAGVEVPVEVKRCGEGWQGGGCLDLFLWWVGGSVCLNGVFCDVWK